MFKIKNKYKKTREGVLDTKYGKIKTPNLAIVATHGKIRLLNKSDHKISDPELIISNLFHLWVNNKIKEIKKAGGIHKWNSIKKPTMTDSGGFQVFSLGWGTVHKIGKISKGDNIKISRNFKNPVAINDTGVVFEYENKKYRLTPEKSIKLQNDIGADIIFAFDECTSPYHSYSYNKKSLERTHDWALRSLKTHKKLKSRQLLFGIVQGGIYEDLRKKSSRFMGEQNFDGFGIGGSFGEKQMSNVIGWALSGLPEEKPRHLLGIGKLKDILTAVEQGIDLFDCVIPTREARHGVLYTKKGRINIKKNKKFYEIYKKDKIKAQRLATIHNIKFYNEFFRKIRQSIKKGKGFKNLKKEYKAVI